MISKIRLKTDGIRSHVFIDDHEVSGVRSFTFSAEPEALPTVLMELDGRDVEVEGKIAVILAALEGKEEGEKDADVQTTGES